MSANTTQGPYQAQVSPAVASYPVQPAYQASPVMASYYPQPAYQPQAYYPYPYAYPPAPAAPAAAQAAQAAQAAPRETAGDMLKYGLVSGVGAGVGSQLTSGLFGLFRGGDD